MEQKIGYIATKNFKQDELIFEVGKTYEITRQFGYAASYVGMYYYKTLEKLISNCDIDINDLKILKVEDLGNHNNKLWNTITTNKLLVICEVPFTEYEALILKKNEGNEYNDKNQLIKSKDKETGIVTIYEYHDNGKISSIKNFSSDIMTSEKKFDKKGRIILEHAGASYYKIYHYEWDNVKPSEVTYNGFVTRYTYNSHNDISYIHSMSDTEWFKYEYDENGNITHLERSNGYEEWKKYDEKGNLISYRDIDDIHFEIIIKEQQCYADKE